MTVQAGIVCGKCDLLNPLGSERCSGCDNGLTFAARNDTTTAKGNETETQMTSPTRTTSNPKEDDSMEQARHLVCGDCFTPVPAGHKFCGKCGASLEHNVVKDPNYFGELQTPGKAKLILIKGEGVDGMSYHLNSTEHKAGRNQGEILFEDDDWLSPLHANFAYVDGCITVRDENSLNGVFVAINEPMPVKDGAVFMAGEQVFRIETTQSVEATAEADGTFFFASPFAPGGFRLVQVLEGGGDGMIVHPKDASVVIGREDADMNFPADPFISGNHAKVESTDSGLVLADLDSKNGTFVKVERETDLKHGDYLFIGRQLLRIEITA